ncbi:MAG: radical SAM protein [Bdellovibrionaceae bacterium]|nr:radical SAM protein [Pseudobdellovibrionaceae bacterium]
MTRKAVMEQIKINEIFYSIQGESSWAGFPTVFIRTSGCHLRCTYCDTKYAYEKGDMMSLDEILSQVARFNSRYVCITGGEPLLQDNAYPLMKTLCDQNYHVSLETSGDIDCSKVDPRVKKIIDVKTPDSGEPNAFSTENLKFADDVNTEFKFIICSAADFDWAENFVREHDLNKNSAVLYSPSYGDISEKWLAKKILSENSPARLQLQLHKYIWNPDTRGV